MFKFDATQYDSEKEYEFKPIPKGDHRIQIESVEYVTFNSGNKGFKLVFIVNGYDGKIFHNLVLNESNPEVTNQKLGEFFNCFGIVDYDLEHYQSWVKHAGAARVKLEEYNGYENPKISYFLNKKKQAELPGWETPESIRGDFKPF